MPPAPTELVGGRRGRVTGSRRSRSSTATTRPSARPAPRARGRALGELKLMQRRLPAGLARWMPPPRTGAVEPELGRPLTRASRDIGSHWCDLIEFVSGQRIARAHGAHRDHASPRARRRTVEIETLPCSRPTPGWLGIDGDLAGLGRGARTTSGSSWARTEAAVGFDHGAARDALGGRPPSGWSWSPVTRATLSPEAAAYVDDAGRSPAGLPGLLRRLRRRDLRGDRRRRPARGRPPGASRTALRAARLTDAGARVSADPRLGDRR